MPERQATVGGGQPIRGLGTRVTRGQLGGGAGDGGHDGEPVERVRYCTPFAHDRQGGVRALGAVPGAPGRVIARGAVRDQGRHLFSGTGRSVQFSGECVQFPARCVQFPARCVQFSAQCVQFSGACVHPVAALPRVKGRGRFGRRTATGKAVSGEEAQGAQGRFARYGDRRGRLETGPYAGGGGGGRGRSETRPLCGMGRGRLGGFGQGGLPGVWFDRLTRDAGCASAIGCRWVPAADAGMAEGGGEEAQGARWWRA